MRLNAAAFRNGCNAADNPFSSCGQKKARLKTAPPTMFLILNMKGVVSPVTLSYDWFKWCRLIKFACSGHAEIISHYLGFQVAYNSCKCKLCLQRFIHIDHAFLHTFLRGLYSDGIWFQVMWTSDFKLKQATALDLELGLIWNLISFYTLKNGNTKACIKFKF